MTGQTAITPDISAKDASRFMISRWKKTLAWLVMLFLLQSIVAEPLLAYTIPIKGYPKLDISGSNQVSLNLNDVSGSQSYFHDDNYDKSRTFTHSSNLYLNGELYKDLSLNATVTADQYSPDHIRWSMRYDGGSAKTLVGEFNANMAGNEFATLSRNLLGVQVDAVLPKGGLSLISSNLKSPVKTDTFYGRNVSGPYYLSATPIVELSEVVTINDVQKERTQDYTLDYQNGILNFSPTILVSPADRVTVSYEVSVNGSGGGQLTAVRGFYPINPNLTVGATRIQLDAHGAGGATQRDERDQFLGNGTTGPFFLTYRPIVVDSEVVTINGILQARATAYTLDNITGRLLFTAGSEPPVNSTVIVRYAVTQPGSAGGGDRAVTGVDVNWQIHSLGVGLQAAKSEGSSLQTIPAQQITDEQFTVQPGILVSQQVFHLRNTPIQANSATVRALALPLVRGVEYTLNDQTGELHILRDNIPISNIGPTLFVSYSTEARTVNLKGNQALALTTNFTGSKVSANAAFRAVDQGFSPIERAGYRNERRALEWGASYMPTPLLTFSTNGNDTRLPYNPYSTTTGDEILMDEKNRTYAMTYRHPNWPVLSLTRTTRDSSQLGTQGLGDASVTDSFALNWTRSPVTASLNLNRRNIDTRQLRYSQDPYQPLPDNPSATDPIYHYQATTNDIALNLNYQPGQKLNINANLAANAIKSDTDGAATRSSGNNAQVTANYQLSKQLTLNANMNTQNTDATKTATGSDVPSLTSTNSSVGADWHANDNKVTLGANYSANSSKGGQYSNSDSRMLGVNAWWQAANRVRLNGYWNRQNLSYPDTHGTSLNNMVGLGAEAGLGKATMNLDAQRIWGNNSIGVAQMFQSEGQAHRQVVMAAADPLAGQTITGNNMLTLAAKVTYPVAPKQDVFLSDELIRNSGFPSRSLKHTLGLGWNYHLNNQLTFTLNAQQLCYIDESNASLNYQARQLNAQMSWNF